MFYGLGRMRQLGKKLLFVWSALCVLCVFRDAGMFYGLGRMGHLGKKLLFVWSALCVFRVV